ncbi:MAG: hypothetical protein K0Q59_1127 [Paenibacillus sp.]|nr:hypothetical protein [Paenibacillus sp.]
MQATVLPFKPLVRVKKAEKVGKTRTPKRFDWITDADMKEINEVDTRGRECDHTEHGKEE